MSTGFCVHEVYKLPSWLRQEALDTLQWPSWLRQGACEAQVQWGVPSSGADGHSSRLREIRGFILGVLFYGEPSKIFWEDCPKDQGWKPLCMVK